MPRRTQLPDVTPAPGPAPSERAPLLAAEHVAKRYAAAVALVDVSLTVMRGECIALVGESGSGKTTLLRCFNRLTEPDAGVVRLGGTDLRGLDPIELRRSVGYVPQDGGLLPHWRVLRNAGLVPWLKAQPDADARASEALRLVGLEPERFAARWPSELSGGQRQRVAIARALAPRPEIVLLDEPFGALDAITRGELQESFGELRARLGITCLLVTHDLQEAVVLATRIAVMRAGRIEQVATPAELVRAPATEYVQRLLARARITGA